MKLGSSLIITVGASPKELVKINGPVNYSSEYLLKEATQEFRARVRHSKTSSKGGKRAYDRHNFEVTQTVYATDTEPEYYRKMYFVLEVLPTDGDVNLAAAVGNIVTADSSELVDELNDWQS